MRTWLTGILVCVALSACHGYNPNQQAEAARMIDRFYAAIDQQDWDAALALYGPSFFAQHPRDAWRQELQSLRQELGPVRQRNMEFAQRDAKYRYDAYIFSFLVQYARGSTRELFTIYRAVDGEGLHIVAHKITRLN